MTSIGALVRFTLIYMGLVVSVGFALQFYEIKANSGVEVGILFASVYIVSYWFGMKNKRMFSANEKRAFVGGILIVCLAYQVIVLLVLSPNGTVFHPILLALALIMTLLYGLFSYWIISFVKKTLLRQGQIEQ